MVHRSAKRTSAGGPSRPRCRLRLQCLHLAPSSRSPLGPAWKPPADLPNRRVGWAPDVGIGPGSGLSRATCECPVSDGELKTAFGAEQPFAPLASVAQQPTFHTARVGWLANWRQGPPCPTRCIVAGGHMQIGNADQTRLVHRRRACTRLLDALRQCTHEFGFLLRCLIVSPTVQIIASRSGHQRWHAHCDAAH